MSATRLTARPTVQATTAIHAALLPLNSTLYLPRLKATAATNSTRIVFRDDGIGQTFPNEFAPCWISAKRRNIATRTSATDRGSPSGRLMCRADAATTVLHLPVEIVRRIRDARAIPQGPVDLLHRCGIAAPGQGLANFGFSDWRLATRKLYKCNTLGDGSAVEASGPLRRFAVAQDCVRS